MKPLLLRLTKATNVSSIRRITGTSALGLSILFSLWGCQPEPVDEATPVPTPTPPTTFTPSFNFQTTNTVKVSIKGKDAVGGILTLPNIEIYDKDPLEGGVLIANGSTGSSGEFSSFLSLPTYLSQVYVISNFVGVISQAILPIADNSIQYTFQVPNQTGARTAGTVVGQPYPYPGEAPVGYITSSGVPNYIDSYESLSNAFLSEVNAALPEKKSIPNDPDRKQYLVETSSNDTQIKVGDKGEQESDVWISFLGEVTSARSSLGYYTYVGTSPTEQELNAKKMIFPNCSMTNSGGNMVPGSRVYLGKFKAGTKLGWFIIANAWDGTKIAPAGRDVLYSNPNLNNSIADVSLRKHSISLKFANAKKMVIGFEDWKRTNKSSDQDFNDVLFYVTANPFSCLPGDNPIYSDCNKNSIPDQNEPDSESECLQKTIETKGTLAFEDRWPKIGDFDMNDLVMDYTHTIKTTASGKVIKLLSKFTVKAIGAGYSNGFGFTLPIASQGVATLQSGSQTVGTYVGRQEQGQDQFTVILFDNAYNLSNGAIGKKVNVTKGEAVSVMGSIETTILFSQRPKLISLGADFTAPFNPFIIANQKRGYEIHLPGKIPTKLADSSIFQTEDDNTTKPIGGIYPAPSLINMYYRTKNNAYTKGHLYYALNLPGNFQWPVEYASIGKAYKKFGSWADSNGTLNTDWYLGTGTDYRDDSKLF